MAADTMKTSPRSATEKSAGTLSIAKMKSVSSTCRSPPPPPPRLPPGQGRAALDTDAEAEAEAEPRQPRASRCPKEGTAAALRPTAPQT